MKLTLPDSVAGTQDAIFIMEVEFPIATVERSVEVTTSGPIEAMDLQGSKAGGSYQVPVGLERLHVPLRVAASGGADASVHVRCTEGPEAGQAASRPVRLEAIAAAQGKSKGAKVALAVLLLAALGVGGFVLGPKLLGGAHEVPEVQGRSLAEARLAMSKAGYLVKATLETVDDAKMHGRVLRTIPSSGTGLDRGKTVEVVVGRSGDVLVRVPSVVGLADRAAENAITTVGLQADVKYDPAPSDAMVDKVFKTTPAAGKYVARGASVELWVGTKPTGTTEPVTIPDVPDPGATDPGATDPGATDPGATDPGATDPGATDPGTTDPGATDPGATDPGTTDPGMGAPLEGQVEVPDLTGLEREQAEKDLVRIGLYAIVDYEEAPDAAMTGRVLRQSPAAGTMIDPTEQVFLTVGTKPDDGGMEDPAKPDPGTTDPGATDPGTTDPGATDPGATDPGATDPGATDPGATDPGATDPGATDPGATDPGTTDPGATDPGATDPGTADPGKPDSGTSDPGTTEPNPWDVPAPGAGTTDPSVEDPGTTDPGTTDSGSTDPGAGDPGATAPGVADPDDGPSENTAPVPDLVALNRDEAEGIVRRAGFEARILLETNDDVDDGIVLSQNPGAGERLALGEEVEIIVARQPPADGVSVPDVIGLTRTDAERRLRKQGFLVRVSYGGGGTQPPGHVDAQAPEPGASAERRTWVELVVIQRDGGAPRIPTGGPPPRIASGEAAGTPPAPDPDALVRPPAVGDGAARVPAPTPRGNAERAVRLPPRDAPKTVTVPHLVDMEAETAITLALEAGLIPIIQVDRTSEAPQGQITRQRPASETMALPGDLLRLRVGIGDGVLERMVDLPTVAMVKLTTAKRMLARLGVRVNVVEIANKKHPYAGTKRVAAQYPVSLVPRSAGNTVTLWIVE